MHPVRKLIFFVLILALAACGPAGAGKLVQSDKPRDPQPQVDDADLAALVRGDNAFAFDLYRQASGGDGNLFFSPYSISTALAMTYAGARGDTAAQMAAALHYALAQAALHPAFNRLALTLDSRAQAPGLPAGKAFTLHTANALWGQDGFPFQSDFLDLLAQNYGAGMHLLNFKSDPEAARQTINDWVSQETEKRITDIVPSGAIDPLTRLVLANAIYFKADWASEFEKIATADGDFTLLDGSRVSVPFMFQEGSFRYTEGDGLQALELPYSGGDLSMLVILPQPGSFDAVQSALSAGELDSLVAGLDYQYAQVWLPKFHFDYSLDLNAHLQALGMSDAFDPDAADFSGMDGRRDLYIGSVLHKAYVAVDEAGTEAAAASAVVVQAASAPVGSPIVFRADRPFLFAIRDNPTGTILFLGRVMDPAQ